MEGKSRSRVRAARAAVEGYFGVGGKVTNRALVFSILIDISWGLIAWLILALMTRQVGLSLAVGVLYMVIHPLVGALTSRIVLLLCAGIDAVFELDDRRWSAWTGSAEIIFASFWPITAAPTIVFLAVGVSLGWFHKLLFNR